MIFYRCKHRCSPYFWNLCKENKNAAGISSEQHNFGCGNPEYYLELFIDDFIILERYDAFETAFMNLTQLKKIFLDGFNLLKDEFIS